ncbi:ankyrin repeat and SOCS box protein 8-like isoform X1 [Mizuhopecten yessoensis]|nr:ankyrin repeat and SOCS box protein 8-like isoform X1 [Mizuhopecten yessoensis]
MIFCQHCHSCRSCVHAVMWYTMANAQMSYQLSERLIRAISNWQTFTTTPDKDIEDLINQGADVNRLHGTLLPLHCACMVTDMDTLKLLLEKGARVNDVDGYERAALHYAAERDALSVEILLQNGADLNARDGNLDTPLHWAAFKNNIECVKLLLQKGAYVDAQDYNLDTPLSWASRKGHLAVIELLLEYNASVDLKSLHGHTPLMRAAMIQATGLNTDADDACLELLLKASGQFDLRTDNGQLRSKVEQDNKLREMLIPLCENVRTLQDISRHAVRQKLGYRFLPNIIPKLPIPQQLREFVLLQR